ncbi:hypothetical protein M9Y10_009155 [Tritrichomonas musculus]|uniref:Uncharacterized protein n=1 Tax=Tritrichomonas musculus TaxID=1915356 RepID=A0ABR2J111_9EUKA
MSKMIEIDFTNYEQTPIIKSMTKSKSIENLQLTEHKLKAETKRGRKSKYSNDEERKEAWKRQQKEYRQRIKNELIEMKKHIEEYK